MSDRGISDKLHALALSALQAGNVFAAGEVGEQGASRLLGELAKQLKEITDVVAVPGPSSRTMGNAPIRPRFLTPAEALWLSPYGLGLRPIPERPDTAARTSLCRGKFPFVVRKICGHTMVDVRDIDAWVPPDPDAAPPKWPAPPLLRWWTGPSAAVAVHGKCRWIPMRLGRL